MFLGTVDVLKNGAWKNLKYQGSIAELQVINVSTNASLPVYATGDSNFNSDMEQQGKPSKQTTSGLKFYELFNEVCEAVDLYFVPEKMAVDVLKNGAWKNLKYQGSIAELQVINVSTNASLPVYATGDSNFNSDMEQQGKPSKQTTSGLKFYELFNESYESIDFWIKKIVTQKPELDQFGIKKLYADKADGRLETKFEPEVKLRTYQSGKPSEWSLEDTNDADTAISNQEVTYYVKINGFKTNEPDTLSIKTLGPSHQDGSGRSWFIHQVMTDGSNKMNFQTEMPHPKNHDNHQQQKFVIGESIVGKWIGVKCVNFLVNDGTDRHLETWIDFPVPDINNPPNNWRKYIEIASGKSLDHGFVKPTGALTTLRIDGIEKDSPPDVKYQSVREINENGEGGTDTGIPPKLPIPAGLIYDSNTDGKWKNGNPRTVDGMDPDCPKVFTGGKGLEMHASGNPHLEIDGQGSAILSCQPGHGRFYVDVSNYNSILEYEVNFLDGSVENNTLNLRSRHQEGDPPANRMGGIQAKLDLKNYDFKTEIYHNVHENSSGDKPLPRALELNKWYKVRYTVKDVGTSLYQALELDYGNGFEKVGEQTIKNPNKVYMEKDKIMERSYFWIRMNNSKNAKLGIRNVKLFAL